MIPVSEPDAKLIANVLEHDIEDISDGNRSEPCPNGRQRLEGIVTKLRTEPRRQMPVACETVEPNPEILAMGRKVEKDVDALAAVERDRFADFEQDIHAEQVHDAVCRSGVPERS